MSEASEMLGGFKLLGRIKGGNEGRQGTLYRAECIRETVAGVACGDIVALKTIRCTTEGDQAFAKLQKRTQRLAALNHPNVLRYRGCFEDVTPFHTLHVIVMDLLEGETLKDRLARNPQGLDADEALRIVNGALSGLVAAAKAGIVHRDIKPGNIFLCRNGAVKLIDFELGRMTNGTITASGSFIGTFNYMAPEFAQEQFRGDETSDVFSMGVVLHEALTGKVPYAKNGQRGEQADFAFLSRWKQRVEGLCVIQIDPSVGQVLIFAEDVLRRALADERAARYQTAEAFQRELQRIRLKVVSNGSGQTYRYVRQIGKGGFGEVFKARGAQGRLVAVKRLLDAHYGDRFRREANVMRKLDNPAFVRFIDYFDKEEPGCTSSYLVMDYLPGMPGHSLRDAIKGRSGVPLPPRDVLRAFSYYARGLEMMHASGIYHRDIKPGNLYYPSDPSKAVIMDLGIARDVNGSVTTDNVPGTLDYMPYEIAYRTSRGDAAMDIYALGLSLYEALTSKTAFPRLPSGQAGLAEFFERARKKVRPQFADPLVTGNPQLLKLLVDMTEIDVARRLQSAQMVSRRIESILKGDREPVDFAPNPPSTAPQDIPTRKTHDSLPPPPMPALPWGRIVIRGFLGAALLGALAVGVKTCWEPVRNWCVKTIDASRERKLRETDEEIRRQEKERREKNCQRAGEGADRIVQWYADTNMTLLAVDLKAYEWQTNWCANADVAERLAEATNRFAVAKRSRQKADAERKARELLARARRENEVICTAYADLEGSVEPIDARAEVWRRKWGAQIPGEPYAALAAKFPEARQNRLDREKARKLEQAERDARRNDLITAARAAAEQAQAVLGAFTNENVLVSQADAQAIAWQTTWGRYKDEAFHGKWMDRIETARRERALGESGRRVVEECMKWLDNIALASESNIANWRDNLAKAEVVLKKAEDPDNLLIDARTAAQIRREIAIRGHWVVGVIANKTGREVRFGGQTIATAQSQAVVFKSGYPAGAAVSCEGYESMRVSQDRFDGKVVTLTPFNLIKLKVAVRARVPEFGENVVCLVDGIEAKPGEIVLAPVAVHHVIYRRLVRTYPGIDDYREQNMPFKADVDRVVEIPKPNAWVKSPECETAERESKRADQGRRIIATVEGLLSPEPIETRRKRLDSVHAILWHKDTAEVLAQQGVAVESELKAKWERERRRVRGLVRNDTVAAATIRTDAETFHIPTGKTVMVTFENANGAGWTGKSYAELPNYEYVFLPHDSADFDGRVFTIRQEKLTPIPMRVSPPPLERGVTCQIGTHRDVTKPVQLRPGSYEVVYRRPDHREQTFTVTVEIGKNLALPEPKAWEPKDAMSRFSEALAAFNSGASQTAREIVDTVGTIEDPERRRELENLKKAIQLREQLEGVRHDE